jgi:hypothetical protein
MSTFADDVRDLEDTVHNLAVSIVDLPPDVEHIAACREVLERSFQQLKDLRENLDTALGEAMTAHQMVVDGVGVIRRHRKRSRTEWAKDDLLRAVLDSRLVDPHTGEIADETPLDKVRHVWNLGAPRVTALRDRGLDPDEFCRTELRDGWTIEVTRAKGGA